MAASMHHELLLAERVEPMLMQDAYQLSDNLLEQQVQHVLTQSMGVTEPISHLHDGMQDALHQLTCQVVKLRALRFSSQPPQLPGDTPGLGPGFAAAHTDPEPTTAWETQQQPDTPEGQPATELISTGIPGDQQLPSALDIIPSPEPLQPSSLLPPPQHPAMPPPSSPMQPPVLPLAADTSLQQPLQPFPHQSMPGPQLGHVQVPGAMMDMQMGAQMPPATCALEMQLLQQQLVMMGLPPHMMHPDMLLLHGGMGAAWQGQPSLPDVHVHQHLQHQQMMMMQMMMMTPPGLGFGMPDVVMLPGGMQQQQQQQQQLAFPQHNGVMPELLSRQLPEVNSRLNDRVSTAHQQEQVQRVVGRTLDLPTNVPHVQSQQLQTSHRQTAAADKAQQQKTGQATKASQSAAQLSAQQATGKAGGPGVASQQQQPGKAAAKRQAGKATQVDQLSKASLDADLEAHQTARPATPHSSSQGVLKQQPIPAKPTSSPVAPRKGAAASPTQLQLPAAAAAAACPPTAAPRAAQASSKAGVVVPNSPGDGAAGAKAAAGEGPSRKVRKPISFSPPPSPVPTALPAAAASSPRAPSAAGPSNPPAAPITLPSSRSGLLSSTPLSATIISASGPSSKKRRVSTGPAAASQLALNRPMLLRDCPLSQPLKEDSLISQAMILKLTASAPYWTVATRYDIKLGPEIQHVTSAQLSSMCEAGSLHVQTLLVGSRQRLSNVPPAELFRPLALLAAMVLCSQPYQPINPTPGGQLEAPSPSWCCPPVLLSGPAQAALPTSLNELLGSCPSWMVLDVKALLGRAPAPGLCPVLPLIKSFRGWVPTGLFLPAAALLWITRQNQRRLSGLAGATLTATNQDNRLLVCASS